MRRFCFCFTITLLALCGFVRPAPAQQTTVSKAEARCIADNVDTFLDDLSDPVMIYLDICLPSDRLKGQVAGTVRADLPSIGKPKTDGKATKSISLSKAALRCLKSAAAAPGFPDADSYVLA
ncbi:hypothetical protein NLM27_24800 [Bradyrhizobium sp. CCGB12]|uniref:hypothetical protein n=1 Tax=Bradyrhizobium sp. CCGB12 TaxID=2949632 RepID=UPI0020B2688F|nr:hypothetical protein [Bradyrhizobium sp. CCGB12]MCP3392017.1 hypothetical protein [Bradyrhizobium sp. CCGB12]